MCAWYVHRYKSSMIPTPAFKKLSQEKKNEKVKEENTGGAEAAGGSDDTKTKKLTETKDKLENKRGIPVLKNRVKPKSESQGKANNRFFFLYKRTMFITN